MYAERAAIQGRKPLFVYFGGGTPSYLSTDQMKALFGGLRERLPLDAVEEITFECEPGTLEEAKIRVLHELGVTRISLGVENFDPKILELNNRAHRAKEVMRTYEFARSIGFAQINIDLIAGMVGETDENWQRCIEQAIALAPDSITIYQMELPFNTTISRRMKDGSSEEAPVADWPTKRRWVDEAYRALEAEGYRIGSAYTAAKGNDPRFLYRDGLWRGADMLGLGVASFSHLDGVHFPEQTRPRALPRSHRGRPESRAPRVGPDGRGAADPRVHPSSSSSESSSATTSGASSESIPSLVLRPPSHATPNKVTCLSMRIASGSAVPELLQIDRLLHDFFLEDHRQVRYA